jgi:hypothetical protein
MLVMKKGTKDGLWMKQRESIINKRRFENGRRTRDFICTEESRFWVGLYAATRYI